MAWTLKIEDITKKEERMKFAKVLKTNGFDLDSTIELTGLKFNEIENL